MENNKMITTAKNLDIFAKIGGGIFRAVSTVCLIFAVLVLVLGEKMFSSGGLSLELDVITIHLTDDFQTITDPMKYYTALGLLIIGVLCWIVGYALNLVRRILAPMKEGRPFAGHIPGDLRKIGWVTVIGGTIVQLLGIATCALTAYAFPMEEIFSSAAIAQVEYNFSFDFSYILIACVIFFLSYIFSYGQALQRESDETL